MTYCKDSAIKTGVLFGLSFGDFCIDLSLRRVKFFAFFSGCLAASPKLTIVS